jgi:hypothetical protein
MAPATLAGLAGGQHRRGRITRQGQGRFDRAMRREVARKGTVYPWRKIIDAVFTACADPAGCARCATARCNGCSPSGQCHA